ncbi:MAG: LysR family transcriptional regulator [Clostridiales Family XIII bacterium]|jgi:DNA-binding transcriptional LysR family regulator|nr:LysR family transcriptional regulator [Clostridiales Family XIII bacterium]
MEIRQLHYFIVVAEVKSFARASEKLYLSQQAISKAIRNLEDELDCVLFERTKAGLSLTYHGKALLEKAARIVSMAEDTISELGPARHTSKKIIRFGIPFRVFEEFDADLFFSFQRQHPDWALRITESTDSAIENMVFRGRLDIGCIGAKGDISSFDFYPVKKSPTYIAVHRDNPLSKRRGVALQDLQREIFIVGNRDYNAQSELLRALERVGFVPQIGYEISNIIWVRRLLDMNSGIFPCPGVPPLLQDDPNLVFLPIEDDPFIYDSYIITKKQCALSCQAEAFKRHLIQIAEAEQGRAEQD